MRFAGRTENTWLIIFLLIALAGIGMGIWEWLMK